MKKLFTFATLLLALTSLNALSITELTANETLSQEIKNSLENILVQKRTPYTVAGLLYTGLAQLSNQRKTFNIVKKNPKLDFVLFQNDGYITYALTTNKTFDSYSLEIISDEENHSSDPHHVNTYSLLLKLYKGKKVILEHLQKDIIESNHTSTRKEGAFYTNLAINAVFKDGRFFILDQEPNTCSQEIDMRKGGPTKTLNQTYTYIDHEEDCCDLNHCSCPSKTTTKTRELQKEIKEFTIFTDSCKQEDACVCPKYIFYAE